MGRALRYIGLFIIGYFLLVKLGIDHIESAQWTLIGLVAFHEIIVLVLKEIHATSKTDNI